MLWFMNILWVNKSFASIILRLLSIAILPLISYSGQWWATNEDGFWLNFWIKAGYKSGQFFFETARSLGMPVCQSMHGGVFGAMRHLWTRVWKHLSLKLYFSTLIFGFVFYFFWKCEPQEVGEIYTDIAEQLGCVWRKGAMRHLWTRVC